MHIRFTRSLRPELPINPMRAISVTKLVISMTKLEYKVLCSRDFQQMTNDNKAFLIIVVVTQCKRDLYLCAGILYSKWDLVRLILQGQE